MIEDKRRRRWLEWVSKWGSRWKNREKSNWKSSRERRRERKKNVSTKNSVKVIIIKETLISELNSFHVLLFGGLHSENST